MPTIPRRGLMFVLSSPSGAGKTTLARALLDSDPSISMSVSVTTRPKRPGEVEGKDYRFIDKGEFDRLVATSALLEHAKVFDNFYGTPRKPVEDAMAQGRDVLFDIDWQGTQQLVSTAPNDLVRVFILPPTMQALERRLQMRAQDTAEVVARRMARAADEMSHWAEYDYVLINNDIDQSLSHVRAILQAERLRRQRQVGLNEFVANLRRGI
jgi:guanylate kinase